MPSMTKIITENDGSTWLGSPIGCYLLNEEQALFDDVVSDIFGFNAIQLGFLQADLLRNSRVPLVLKASETKGDLLCETQQLPISSNTMDLVLLPHTLDFSINPQQTLREVERVLVAEGHVVITGFNPISSWGLRRFVSKRCASSSAMWHAHFLSALRIKDWLNLLGFEIVGVRMACYKLPLQSTQWLQRFDALDRLGARYCPMLGGVYCIVAKKRILGMRIIKPNWARAKMKRGLVISPTKKEDVANSVTNDQY
ncbi:Methyltransferase type 11 [Candidatus Methylopumilus turicensis]|jgi:SAM-dependent methyltransferase|uniref:Methyltransferase type 11 n=2 Tax=Candidatus Methylopumilus turicensis TaxID=1581680 RepID=A0A0B7IUW9_9PROT|nr:Methyltransferase type 11 [Candidatus Methylopumilus turicensis]